MAKVVMPQPIDQIHDAIHERKRDNMGVDDWVVYVPHDMMPEINNLISNRSPMETYKNGATIAGHQISPDGFIDEPILLPDRVQDLNPSNGVVENAPEQLIRQTLRAYGIEQHTDELRGVNTYKTRLFFDVEDKHTKLNHAKINRYNLNISETEAHTEPEEYERVTLGHQFTDELQLREPEFDESYIERQFADAVDRQIHSVTTQPVYGTRTRRIKMPYSVLDTTITERIRCGTKYTHWGGVFLPPVDVSAQKLTFDQSARA